jgi:pimeloyl-ACP methyl ester carboxylesterase
LTWLLDLLQIEPPRLYASMGCPMLLIAGAKDVQCDPTNMQSILEVVAAPTEWHVVPDLTHVLRFDDGDPSIFKYTELLKRPIEAEVLEIISRWIARQTRIAHPPVSAMG